MDTLLTWVVCAVGLCGAELAYWLPLKKRRNFTMRTALNFIAAVLFAQVIIWANSGHANPAMLLVIYGGYFIWAAVSTHLCTLLDWSASAYCSIWIVLTTESAYELWRVLIWTAQTLGMRHLPLHSTPMPPGAAGLYHCLLCDGPVYHGAHNAGGRHLPHRPSPVGQCRTSGRDIRLSVFCTANQSARRAAAISGSRTVDADPVLLRDAALFTDRAFQKAAMQKEMDALNLLYDRQRKQYQIARQNVQIINRKCHELKVQIADLRRLQPDEATTQSLDEAEQAARMYDANAATGNEVLDVVLTEKSLLCEAQRIRLNCVADGTCLAAIEPGDLYALFSNLLDQAIDAAAQQQNDRRMIDLLVCRRQGFAVINVIGPALSGSQSDHGRRHSYELKVARRVVQKYSGTMATEPRGELFAVKIVMPLTRG